MSSRILHPRFNKGLIACEGLLSGPVPRIWNDSGERRIHWLLWHQRISIYLHLAKFCWARNRHQESFVPAQRAVAINPRSAEAYYVLRRLLDELGQEAEAMKALKQSIEIDPGLGQSYYLLSRIYLRRGQEDEAAKAMSAFKSRRTTSMPGGNKANPHPVEDQ
jgi:tetratricopeptide (TPR) repeat protein